MLRKFQVKNVVLLCLTALLWSGICAQNKASDTRLPVSLLPKDAVGLSDGSLVGDFGEDLSNPDRRPIFKVDGRITNKAKEIVTRVIIHIKLTDEQGSVVDENDLDLPITIPSLESRGFSRRIQLLSPQAKWQWNWEVARVESQPSGEFWDNYLYVVAIPCWAWLLAGGFVIFIGLIISGSRAELTAVGIMIGGGVIALIGVIRFIKWVWSW
jgi:hypothetical protein